MKRLVVLGSVVLGVALLFGAIHHHAVRSLNIPSEVSANWCSGGNCQVAPASSLCNQTPWQETNYQPGGLTASVSSPALGTNCTKHVLNLITANLADGTESCFQDLYVEDGTRQIWQYWLVVSTSPGNATVANFSQDFPITSFLHNNTDGTQTLVIVGMGPQTANTATVTFGGNCAHSGEAVSIIGHDE